jgi:hypothetical protein
MAGLHLGCIFWVLRALHGHTTHEIDGLICSRVDWLAIGSVS